MLERFGNVCLWGSYAAFAISILLSAGAGYEITQQEGRTLKDMAFAVGIVLIYTIWPAILLRAVAFIIANK